MYRADRLDALATKYAHGSLDDREADEFARELQQYVYSVLGTVHIPTSPLAEINDLLQVGVIGGYEAASHFDLALASFASFARNRVRGAVIDYLRRIDILPRGARGDVAYYLSEVDKNAELGDRVSHEKFRRDNAWSETRWNRLMSALRARFTLSGDAIAYKCTDQSDTLWDHTPGKLLDPDHGAESAVLERWMRALPERSRRLVEMYYLDGMTYKEIGAHFGFTEANAHIIKTKALKQLRQALANEPGMRPKTRAEIADTE